MRRNLARPWRLLVTGMVVACGLVGCQIADRSALDDPPSADAGAGYVDEVAADILAIKQRALPGNNAFFNVNYGDYYVQCLAKAGEPQVFCEAVSPYSVPWVGETLTPEKRATLAALGYAPPGFTRNYSQFVLVADQADAKRLAVMLLRTLSTVYNYRDDSPLIINIKLPPVAAPPGKK